MLKRREFLWCGLPLTAAAREGLTIIDTHAHIYSEDEKRYPTTAKPLRPPAGTGTVAHLKRMLAENGVARACIVQTSTFYRFDNRFICDTAVAEREWTAGVCTLDPDDARSPAVLREFARKYGIRALRSIPGKDGRMDSPGVQELWKAAGDSRLIVNVLCGGNNADAVAGMLEKFARQPVVLDHCMNLRAGQDHGSVLADLLRIAKYPNAHAKLTFLATGSAEPYPFRDLHDSCRRLITAYTPGRCVWGSDFPCELWTRKATYSQNLRLFTAELGLEDAAKKAILGDTARRLYFS